MIDEDLYQQAADELNSGNRKASVWARACALASDDHDEARYLYTNLRVEELIKERDQKAENATEADDDKLDSTLALEPLEQEQLAQSVSELDSTLSIDETSSLARDALSLQADPDLDDNESPDELQSFFTDTTGSLIDTDEDLTAAVEDAIELDQTSALDSELDDESSVANETINAELWQLEQKEQAKQRLDEAAEKTVAGARLNDDDEDSESTLFDRFDDTASLDGTSVVDFEPEELAEFQASMAEKELQEQQTEQTSAQSSTESPDSLEQNHAQLNDILEGVDTPVAGNEPSPTVEELIPTDHLTKSASSDPEFDANNLDWLDDEPGNKQLAAHNADIEIVEPELNDTDRLELELERQAQDLPGQQQSDVVAYDDTLVVDLDKNNAEPPPNIAASAASAAAAGAAAAAAYRAANPPPTHSRHHPSPQPYREPEQQIKVPPPEYPVNLTRGGNGTHYSIYKRNDQVQVVKDGVSWSALVATLPFLIYRHLFGTAIVYLLMAAVVALGLIITGMSWIDQGQAASPFIKGGLAGFAFLALIGLVYLPFRHGNKWRSKKLESRGFEMVAWVEASSPGRAISRARRASALD